MLIKFICQDLYKSIERGSFEGLIHSVFANSFNVMDDNKRIISILNCDRSMAPNSIRTNNRRDYRRLGLVAGYRVLFTKDYIEIRGTSIRFYYNNLKLWDRRPDLSFNYGNRKEVELKLRAMGEFLVKEGERLGIYPLIKSLSGKIPGIELLIDNEISFGPNEEFMSGRFLEFFKDYINEDGERLSQTARRIVGYGIGLTPSMDDFLAGLMGARIYLSAYLGRDKERVFYVNERIVKDIEERTTIISEEMLTFASRGEINQYAKELIISLLGEDSMERFIANLRKLISIGETSGTDMLLGIYTSSCLELYGHKDFQ